MHCVQHTPLVPDYPLYSLQLVHDGGLRLAGCVPQPPDPVPAE